MGESHSDGTPAPAIFEYRFPTLPWKEGGVVVDQASGTIRFEHCFQPNRFLGGIERTYVCPVDDLIDTHRLRYRGESLTIVLRGGKAAVGRTDGPGFVQLCDILDGLIPPGRQGSELNNPWLGLSCVGAAAAGALAGWLITPTDSSDLRLFGSMIALALAGVAANGAFVVAAQRLTGLRLATPMGTGFLGCYAGVLIWIAALTTVGSTILGSLGIFGGCYLLGASAGVWLVRRKDARRAAAWAGRAKPPADDWERDAFR